MVHEIPPEHAGYVNAVHDTPQYCIEADPEEGSTHCDHWWNNPNRKCCWCGEG